jgi:hypothetical protein
MANLLIAAISGLVGLAAFGLMVKKYGGDCLP